jgi:hypothetical protein
VTVSTYCFLPVTLQMPWRELILLVISGRGDNILCSYFVHGKLVCQEMQLSSQEGDISPQPAVPLCKLLSHSLVSLLYATLCCDHDTLAR